MYRASEWIFLDLWRFINLFLLLLLLLLLLLIIIIITIINIRATRAWVAYRWVRPA